MHWIVEVKLIIQYCTYSHKFCLPNYMRFCEVVRSSIVRSYEYPVDDLRLKNNIIYESGSKSNDLFIRFVLTSIKIKWHIVG